MFTLPSVPRVGHAHSTEAASERCDKQACPTLMRAVHSAHVAYHASRSFTTFADVHAPDEDAPKDRLTAKQRAMLDRMDFAARPVKRLNSDSNRHAMVQMSKKDTAANISTQRAWAKSRKHGGQIRVFSGD